MITIMQAILLGIIQGVTEWLPVSSSGHLVIFQQLFGLNEGNVVFDLFLHVGSLFVVLYVFRENIKQIILSFVNDKYKKYRKLAYLVVIGTIPTALIGYFFQDFFEAMFSTLLPVGIALLITGLLLFFCERFEKKKELSTVSALGVGVMQGIAIMPGISRSGSTIAAALFFGIKKEDAVSFSFLLFIPAILGASVLQFSKLGTASVEWMPVILGTVTAVVIGYFALNFLIKIVRQKKLKFFSYYCWIVGILAIVVGLA
jgi:undecaprenyl-diphosphatase